MKKICIILFLIIFIIMFINPVHMISGFIKMNNTSDTITEIGFISNKIHKRGTINNIYFQIVFEDYDFDNNNDDINGYVYIIINGQMITCTDIRIYPIKDIQLVLELERYSINGFVLKVRDHQYTSNKEE